MSEEVLRAALEALEPPLERRRVTDDGNSLFRAIAHQLDAHQLNAGYAAAPRRRDALLHLRADRQH